MKLRTNVNARALGMKNDHLVEMILIGIFAAFCYVAVWVLRIPLPPQFIHFGNAVCVMTALLLGGWQGGAAGAIGMALFNLLNGMAAFMPKTLLLKFLMGLVTGLVFFYGRRHPKSNPTRWVALASFAALLTGFGLFIGLYTDFFTGEDAEIKMLWYAIIFLMVLGFSLLIVLFISMTTQKFSRLLLWAILGATLGVFLNVTGEFCWALTEKLLLGMNFSAAAAATLIDIPATFINGSFTVFAAVGLYVPLNAALVKAGLLKSEEL